MRVVFLCHVRDTAIFTKFQLPSKSGRSRLDLCKIRIKRAWAREDSILWILVTDWFSLCLYICLNLSINLHKIEHSNKQNSWASEDTTNFASNPIEKLEVDKIQIKNATKKKYIITHFDHELSECPNYFDPNALKMTSSSYSVMSVLFSWVWGQ